MCIGNPITKTAILLSSVGYNVSEEELFNIGKSILKIEKSLVS